MLEFSRLGWKHKDQFNKVVKPYKYRNSESSFNNLYLWGESENIEVAFGQHAMYLRFTLEEEKILYFTPFLYDISKPIKPAISEIRHFLNREEESFCIHGLIKEYKEKIENEFDHFVFKESRNNFDYVYTSESLINLSGKKLSSKRNHINYFLNNYEFEYKKYDAGLRADCEALMASWSERQEDKLGIFDESIAFAKIMDKFDQLDMKGACIYVDGKLEAFTFGEALTDELVLVHFEKANTDIRGLYPYINQQFVKNEWADYKYINREEDMGIEGLRKAKMSYKPEFFVEKYTCSLDGNCHDY